MMASTIAPSRRPKLSLQINSSEEQQFPATAKSIFGPSIIGGGSLEPMSAVERATPLPFGRCSAYTATIPSSPRTTRSATRSRVPPSLSLSKLSQVLPQVHSPSDSETESENDKFWSGEDSFSSATSSEDDDESDSEKKKYSSNTIVNGVSRVVLPTPAPQSPFLPPARNTLLNPKAGNKKLHLRLNTAVVPNESNQITTPTTTESPASFLPLQRPAIRMTKLTLSIPSLQQTPSSLSRRQIPPSSTSTPASSTRKSSMASSASSSPRKSVSFSPLPDTIISTSRYTLSNSDLLSYLSTDCSEEDLAERWGLTLEDVKLLGLSKKEKMESGNGASKLDRRERKWIGLTNSFLASRSSPQRTEEGDEI